MGFAAIARVTEDRWVTCTTKDNISFGLKPGDELDISTTICTEVHKKGEPVFIDQVAEDLDYSTHPVPKMYGFKSYISVPIYRQDGSFFGTLCSLDPNPAKVKTPEIEGMFKLFAELISFHLSSQEKIELANAKLEEEESNRQLREQFIAILGHDLRNPLATTRMSAEILLHKSQDEFVRRQARMIKSTSVRMEGLIGNILDFARGRLGEGINLSRKPEKDKLQEIFNQVIKEIRAISPEREIEVNMKFKKEVHCDRERIGQLFSNLLGNADTHGAKELPIKIHIESEDKDFFISISNGGEKIPESAQKLLFQPFYRDEVQKGKQGLGLGLFIALEIAKAHGGKIEVSSTEEETCFKFHMRHNQELLN